MGVNSYKNEAKNAEDFDTIRHLEKFNELIK